MNKIAIVGAHGSGKSTLSEKIQEEAICSTLSVLDLARLCPHLVGKESTQKAQEWILTFQLTIEKRLSGQMVPVIFDGCSLGHLAYYKYWGGNLAKFRDKTLKSTLAFDRMYLLPPNPDFLYDDGLRPTDVIFQQQIFNIQKEILDFWGIEYQAYTPLDTFSISTFLFTANESVKHGKKSIQCLVKHGQYYLMKETNAKETEQKNGSLELVQGGVLESETLEIAAERIVLEKTGYLTTASKHPLTYETPRHKHIVECLLVEPIRFTTISNNNITNYQWVHENVFRSFIKKTDL